MTLLMLHIKLPAEGAAPQGAETLLQSVPKRLIFQWDKETFPLSSSSATGQPTRSVSLRRGMGWGRAAWGKVP